jgi:hypothetical protein
VTAYNVGGETDVVEAQVFARPMGTTNLQGALPDPVIVYVPLTTSAPITPTGWMLTDFAGTPLTGVTGTFLFYGDPFTGASRTPPTIVERTGGLYGFTPSSADVANGVAWVIDNGLTANPRYVAGTCYRTGAPIGIVFLQDLVGALWTGAAPIVGVFADSTGAARPPPNLVKVPGLTYLWAYKPTWTDVLAGASIRINGPAGSVISYLEEGPWDTSSMVLDIRFNYLTDGPWDTASTIPDIRFNPGFN